jgi:hypothetical protein
MPTIDLTNTEAVAIATLMDALGGGDPALALPFLQQIGGPWAETIRAKLAAVASATARIDAVREALGRYAATAQTAQEVDDLRAQMAAYVANLGPTQP